MKLAEVFIRTGHHRNILIINAEFSMVEDFAIRPHLFNLSSVDQLKWRLPIFTIGEAATATLVCPGEESQRWSSVNVTDNDAYDLCSVMAPWYRANAVDASPRLAKDRAGLFTSWAADLSARGIPLALDAFKKSAIRPQEVDILFTHASSTRDWKMIASKIGMSDKLYDIHPRYGNLVSASVPAAIALAVQDGRLKRGMNIAALVASAGMTATAASIVY
jgi:3-oxoacyl-[acyl-carrier-protein] synthase III